MPSKSPIGEAVHHSRDHVLSHLGIATHSKQAPESGTPSCFWHSATTQMQMQQCSTLRTQVSSLHLRRERIVRFIFLLLKLHQRLYFLKCKCCASGVTSASPKTGEPQAHKIQGTVRICCHTGGPALFVSLSRWRLHLRRDSLYRSRTLQPHPSVPLFPFIVVEVSP